MDVNAATDCGKSILVEPERTSVDKMDSVSRQTEFRADVEGFLSSIKELLDNQPEIRHSDPEVDDELKAEWADDAECTLSFHLQDSQSFLDEVPVNPPALCQIRDEILNILMMQNFKSGQKLSWRDCDQGLPVLAKRLSEMLEYLPPPQGIPGATPQEQVRRELTANKTLRRRGPKPDQERHRRIAEIVKAYGDNWKEASHLDQIAAELDRQKIEVSKKWPKQNPSARSWKRALEFKRERMIKAIDYSLSTVAEKE